MLGRFVGHVRRVLSFEPRGGWGSVGRVAYLSYWWWKHPAKPKYTLAS